MKTGCGDREFYLLTNTHFSQIESQAFPMCCLQNFSVRCSDSRRDKTPISHLLQISKVLYKGSIAAAFSPADTFIERSISYKISVYILDRNCL